MNPPKCKEEDYIDFLIAMQKACSCTEVARVQPNERVSHDAILRMLHRLGPSSESLWQESSQFVNKSKGCLVIEEYHRGIKQFCRVERCQARTGKVQKNHILFSLRAFLRIERFCFRVGAKIVREAVRAYLKHPKYLLTA